MARGTLSRFAFCGMTAMIGCIAQADTNAESVENVSISSDRSIWDKLSDTATLSYFGIYRGPSLGDISNSLQPKIDGTPDTKNPQQIESLVTTGYKIKNDWMIGVIGHFFYYPLEAPVDAGQNLQLLDPALFISKTNIINKDGFTLNGRFYLTFALTSADSLKPSNLAASTTLMLNANYNVPQTHLSVGYSTYLRNFIPTSAAAPDVITYKIYGAPNANYRINSQFAATLWVDLFQISRNGGTGLISGMSNFTVDVEPGFSWDITKNITLNPILNIYPANLTLAATSLQASIIAKAF